MDRRDFFKKILMTPALAPMLLAANRTKGEGELYLITDNPEVFLSHILQGLQKFQAVSGINFAFSTAHPQEKELDHILKDAGWHRVENPSQADMFLAFRHLHQATRPSFSLVKSGQIWDIRSRKLYALWKQMNSSGPFSRSLTVATFSQNPIRRFSGESIAIYQSGRLIDKLTLGGQDTRTYAFESNVIRVHKENGRAWIAESSCRHRICLLSPPVFLAGERIICAPNQFVLEVQGPRSVDTFIG